MKKFVFKETRFLTSAIDQKGCPKGLGPDGKPLPEIAVAGRSNVGKSSLLNHLFGVQNLVKTSQKPGKTRLLNFFKVDDDVIFCDLPGYGFANVKQQMLKSWGPMIENYIENRSHLKAVLMLLDIRRTPSEQDLIFFNWVNHLKIPMILVFTKIDKLSKNAVSASVKKNLAKLERNDLPKVLYSVLKNQGRKELLYEIKALLHADDE
ncbi:MAG: putative GTP-binding protein EngB [Chlamydiae bacterium]|nr:putative GTP-binding protein EngB [Chlamydiota bacterium]